MSKQNKEVPVLSICIPTYNRSCYLNTCLASILPEVKKSSYQIEVLIADNCSTDDTEDIIRKYQDEYDFNYVTHPENIGPDLNFAKCVSIAKGKYVWLFGDDEILYPGILEKIVDVLAVNDFGGLFLKAHGYDEEPAILIDYSGYHELDLKIYEDSLLFMKEININVTFITSNIFNKSLLEKNFDFNRFVGTNLVQTGWTVSSIFRANSNAILDDLAFAAKQNNSGNFKYVTVFVEKFNLILNDLAKAGIDSRIIPVVNKELIKNHLPDNLCKVLYTNTNYIKENTFLICLKWLWKYNSYWKMIFPIHLKYFIKKYFLPFYKTEKTK